MKTSLRITAFVAKAVARTAIFLLIFSCFALSALNLIDLTEVPSEFYSLIFPSPRPAPPAPPAPARTPPVLDEIPAGPYDPPDVLPPKGPEMADAEQELETVEPLAGPIPIPRPKPDMWDRNYMVRVLRSSNSFGDLMPVKDGEDPDLRFWNVWRSCDVPDADPICKQKKSFRQAPKNWPYDLRTAQERRDEIKKERKSQDDIKKKRKRRLR